MRVLPALPQLADMESVNEVLCEVPTMGEVEIVIKVPEGVDPEEIVAKAKALAEWERILKAAEKRKRELAIQVAKKLKGKAEEFEELVAEGYLVDIR